MTTAAPSQKSPSDPVPAAPKAELQAPKPATPEAAQHEAPKTRTEPWAQLVANPGHAPELLALAAVQTIGPRAADWARRLRERYPHATDAGLARLAERQFIRFGGVGSVFAAAAGSYVPVALLSSNALTYAELILHVAAAYRIDPTDRDRAVDLLVLTQVHATPEDAEAALTSAEQPAYEEETRLTDAVWRLARMASAQAGAWALVRGINRLFPGVTVLSAIITSRSGVRTVSARATRFYSRLNQESSAG
ncbi:hypothetical protein [Actinoplanes sp. NPDC089786]|uniref:hypothetical protein n=1 Tax=Actinoplanes sp. NPDC089786 TaxID=3155185 RepID=UPI0034175272